MKGTFAQRSLTWFLRFLQVQLFISLISLPILAQWGLPFSLISPVANLIFSPFLMAFLTCSSLIFFTEILGIPNQPLIWALEHITQVWHYLIKLGNPSWLINMPQPSPLFFIISTVATLAVLQHKTISKTIYRSCLSLAILFFILTGTLKLLYTSTENHVEVPIGKGALTLLKSDNNLALIDPGFLSQKQNPDSWITYTLVPSMRKTFGSTILNHVFVLQPSIRQFQAIEALCKQTTVQHLWLILWAGKSSPHLLRSWARMKYALEKNGGTLHRIGTIPRSLFIDENTIIDIWPLKKTLKYAETTFGAIKIDYQIDKETHTFYSAKYKRV